MEEYMPVSEDEIIDLLDKAHSEKQEFDSKTPFETLLISNIDTNIAKYKTEIKDLEELKNLLLTSSDAIRALLLYTGANNKSGKKNV